MKQNNHNEDMDYEFKTANIYLEDFYKKNKRKLKILNIGNVANYAYVNSKLMRSIGIEADCIDPDFYHIMSTPEWHEAEISGEWGNDFYPKWSNCSIVGYKRPEWFFQGKVDLSFAALAAYKKKEHFKEQYYRNRIEFERKILASDFQGLEKWLWTTKSPLIRVFRGPFRRLQFALDKFFAPKYKFNKQEENLLSQLKEIDFLSEYMKMPMQIKAALSSYDIIIGYTLSGGFALATLYPNLIAYELGTLRGLPYEKSREGRLCKWIYTNAKEVFVTNVDCLDHAKNIGIDEKRITPMLHAYDVDIMMENSDYDISTLNIDKNIDYFLAPARHHWKNGNASWLKGNDVYLHALGELHKKNYDFQLVTVEWGEEIELSKSIISHYGYDKKVIWIKPQCRQIMKALYQNSCAVIDQFNAAAFGGVALDTFSCAKPLITRYDENAGIDYFAKAPQVYNCEDKNMVLAALENILRKPNEAKINGQKLQEWLLQEHGITRQLNNQLKVISRMIGIHNRQLPS